MKPKTARTLLMAGTIIGGVMYFSQTAKAQDTRLQTMTTENRMLYNTKEQLAQHVTNAGQEFNIQRKSEEALSKAINDLGNTIINYRAASDALINHKETLERLNTETSVKNAWTTYHGRLTSLLSDVNRLMNDNQRSSDYWVNNYSQVI